MRGDGSEAVIKNPEMVARRSVALYSEVLLSEKQDREKVLDYVN